MPHALLRGMRILRSTALLLIAFAPQSSVVQQPQPSCGDMVAFQVLLDRAGFSPGQIDGKFGTNASHALSAFQQTRKLTSTGQPDCDSWHALGGDTAGPTTVAYALTPEDLKG